ncbi:hypothetical protein Pint_30408 [Pistacia integerrima]|uniref:Uncharacterized protein n=1 Tax=Pistacia integerrima TaxID=434235 RepID=A0ACC0X0V8_9ROSI|nr:hypothetical protein Pint_30408 [Pistacia integerrima]
MVKPSITETPSSSSSSSSSHSVSPLQTFLVHLICGVGLGARFWVAHNVYSINLVSHPSDTLGALVNALGAISLGAPVGIQYMRNTFDWSLLMSVFTVSLHDLIFNSQEWPICVSYGAMAGYLIRMFVPAASVYSSSWEDWRHIFAHTKPNGSVDYVICEAMAEWPISVSYGAMAGYLIGMVASFGLVLIRGRQQHQKGD